MTCRELLRLISEGRPLSGAAHTHIAGCEACRQLLDARYASAEPLSPEALARYKKAVTGRLTPVRPVASVRQLTYLLIGLFICFTAAATVRAGTAGLRALQWWQAIVYCGVLAAGTLFGASAIVQEIIPGTRRYFSRKLFLLGEGAALFAVVAFLFPSLSTARFVRAGHGCFELGIICAIAAAVLFSFVLREGLPVFPVRTGLVTGFYAGLVGVAVLTIHCPVLSIPHIWSWHLSILPVSMGVGAVLGLLIQKLRALRN